MAWKHRRMILTDLSPQFFRSYNAPVVNIGMSKTVYCATHDRWFTGESKGGVAFGGANAALASTEIDENYSFCSTQRKLTTLISRTLYSTAHLQCMRNRNPRVFRIWRNYCGNMPPPSLRDVRGDYFWTRLCLRLLAAAVATRSRRSGAS